MKSKRKVYCSFKRTMDILVSGIALILLFPVLAIVAILIKLDSKGPVFYIADRAGYKGQAFKFYKFRGLKIYRPELHKRWDDPTVTKVGKVIRRYFIDELPQLINILKGDMSLVGPRPEQMFLVKRHYDIYKQRFTVKPGLTGLWQIRGKEQPIYKHIDHDIEYINNRSIWLDMKIVFLTIPLLFKGEK